MLNVNPHGVLYRLVAGGAGLTMAALGVAPLVKGEVTYPNWFGGMVFVPFAVLFGLFTVYCAIFKPEWLAAKAIERTRRKR